MEIGKFNLIKTEGRARRGEFCTAHGVVQTPVFQNVGTAGAIKGAVDAFDLKELGCQIGAVQYLPSARSPGRSDRPCRWAACTSSCAGTVRC